ncbi:hypothetical protein NNV42_003100 [Escherichia coli]|uniref:hypothetical protein n=1 Tax=Enterobacteriaceae TaxID=543 RepID=UPI0008FCA293|nr:MULTISPECIES: hypothetical protein [Enterobacteriaceae]EAN2380098.1 hypothetical protein [Salmonella enterica]EBG0355714.1 hypothetical protein [Salmonella enterica subsp. enterica serovar Ruiru]EBW8251780.1 hypothetical protein [Salmonella enterica subsp. enterica serovar Typhimurium]EDI1042995.1 hypothetical protein [Salmonella enterica subsp. enterica serovar Give]EDN5375548.1 hypothetical protein [Salmonella enterica subsp. enterica serovar Stanley]EDS5135779.1 hypothetical protein [Sa
MSNKTGGRAFPCDSIVERDEVGHLHGFEVSSGGMTLRDYFAAKAMQAMISNPSIIDNDSDGAVNYAASAAYKFADAMLKARE